MIIHPDLRFAPIPSSDGDPLSVSRLGPVTSPAAVVYLHSPFTSLNHWLPLTTQLHDRLDGRITQLTHHHRAAADRRSAGSCGGATVSDTGADDLDTVLGLAEGAVVVVAHSTACKQVHSWIEKYPHRAHTVAGIVLLNPALDPPEIPSELARRVHDEQLNYLYRTPKEPGRQWSRVNDSSVDRIQASIGAASSPTDVPVLTDTTLEAWRCIPTWMLTGALDALAPPRRCQALAERLWADFDCVPGAGHSLPYAHPHRASQPILAALEVAYRTHLHDGGQPR